VIPAGPTEADAPAGQQDGAAVAAARDSLRVAGWTLVSRLTGVLRVAAIGAVLGPTLLGNTFQFTNSLPNLVYYGFLAGSLFSSLLVPALVVAIDNGDRRLSERIAGGFLGVALAALAVAACVAVLVGPALLRLGSVGTRSDAVGAAQEDVGRLLLLLVIPQVLLYAVIGTSTAVMNAHRRFALAAAAPALENVGLLVVLGLAALVYTSPADLQSVPVSELVLLGGGATAAVGLHAAVQWWGARRVGVTLWPRRGWRHPDVTALVRRALPALGLAGLAALQLLTLLVLSNRVAGGVVAAQMGLTFFFFVVALGATPVALSLLPRLARLHAAGDSRGFRETWMRGVALTLFVTVPAAVGYLVLAGPLAEVVAVGRMATDDGVHLLTVAIAALAPGIVGEGVFQVLTYVFYARHDTRTPLRSMGVQAVTFLALAGTVLLVDDTAVPLVLGLSLSVATTVGACHLAAQLRRDPDRTAGRLVPSIRRVAAGTVLMAAPAWAVGVLVPRWVEGRAGAAVAVVGAAALGAAVYLLLQAWWRSPELAWLTGDLGRGRSRTRGGRT
jgi:putative peptidoglycan lipid II flippase